MKREYIVTGKLTNGNDYEDRVMAEHRDAALLIAIENWQHDPDSIFNSFTEIKVSTSFDKIEKLEEELRSSKQVTFAAIVIAVVAAIVSIL